MQFFARQNGLKIGLICLCRCKFILFEIIKMVLKVKKIEKARREYVPFKLYVSYK